MNDMPQNGGQAVATRKASPAAVFQHDMGKMAPEWQAALPEHIPVERFMRVVQTAVMQTPELMEADRKSLWMACTKCAQDGLLPDGREAALVIRMVQGRKVVTYVPMVAGIKKKVRNSGEISSWDVNIIYENDEYEILLGDEPRFYHKPDFIGEPGKPILVYSVARFKGTSEVSREVMRVAEINRIRDRTDAYKAFKANKIKSTPWESDWGEMAKKTIAKRHAKSLPMSTDLDDLMRRDDDLYDFEEARKNAKDAIEAGGQKQGLAGKMAALAGGNAGESREDEARREGADETTGEIVDHDESTETQAEPGNRQEPPAQGEGEGGKAAGQSGSPATAAPSSAKPKAAPKAKPKPEPQPEPVHASQEADEQEDVGGAAGDGAGPAAWEWGAEERAVLSGYHNALMNAMTEKKLVNFSAAYFDDGVPEEGTPLGDAVTKLYKVHYSRITEGRITAADCDNELKKLLSG